MEWFWDHSADEWDRSDQRASPLLAESLAGLPRAAVSTCEFDPLRDEGAAYAEALAAAGVEVRPTQRRWRQPVSRCGISSVAVICTRRCRQSA